MVASGGSSIGRAVVVVYFKIKSIINPIVHVFSVVVVVVVEWFARVQNDKDGCVDRVPLLYAY